MKGTTRAGRYTAQTGGYSAFLPAPLPPRPPIRVMGELQGLLSDADRGLGRLDGSIQTLPHPDLFVLMYVRKEAVPSQSRAPKADRRFRYDPYVRLFTDDEPDSREPST